MFKYIKYFFPSLVSIASIFAYLQGAYSPTLFLFCFSLLIILGDLFLKDNKKQIFTYPSILNLSLYFNLPLLFAIVFFMISIFSSNLPLWYINGFKFLFNIDFISLKDSFHLIDKISIIIQTSLIGGSIGITAGHELTHRKKEKLDMFIGNWLLAFSCDCNFAIEHVYGHHKNVCLPEDPASAKRNDNIYFFIIRAIYDEHISGWEIESSRLKRKNINLFNISNRMLRGYLRSIFLVFLAFVFGGFNSILFFMVYAFSSKILLEAINYIEHYGLVRERGKPVRMRHSWNSNHFFSSIFLFNLTRHSDHHRNSNLKYWELTPVDKEAPILPYGYLTMLYLVLFCPFIYKRIMKRELLNWDKNYANEFERNLVQNILY